MEGRGVNSAISSQLSAISGGSGCSLFWMLTAVASADS